VNTVISVRRKLEVRWYQMVTCGWDGIGRLSATRQGCFCRAGEAGGSAGAPEGAVSAAFGEAMAGG
jgi:hypothetical protein